MATNCPQSPMLNDQRANHLDQVAALHGTKRSGSPRAGCALAQASVSGSRTNSEQGTRLSDEWLRAKQPAQVCGHGAEVRQMWDEERRSHHEESLLVIRCPNQPDGCETRDYCTSVTRVLGRGHHLTGPVAAGSWACHLYETNGG
jgi:hypothetical protein